MAHIKHSPTWNFYVGDPCYVIDDARWGEFCDLLFANEGYHGDNPAYIEWEVDGETYTVECWDSPGGDGVWQFSGGECGVDAGLLAIVPRECCDRATMGDPAGLGIVFENEPTLETSNNDYVVILNGERDLSWCECHNCSEWVRHDEDECSCDCGDSTGCESCWEPCEECDS